MGRSGDHVFGYASLISDMRREGEELCRLQGYRRSWNVATDNSLTLGRYKIYLDPASGEQPAVFVTFLNLVPEPGASVAGALFPVSAAALEVLDRRERNYERREVGAHIGEPVDGRVWCYFGTAAAERRHRRGAGAGRTVISREYHDRVRAGFAACGREALEDFEATTDAPGCPIVELERVEIE
jgi:cation transport regulator ChaC